MPTSPARPFDERATGRFFYRKQFGGKRPVQLYYSTYSEAKELQDDIETYLGTARLASVQHFHPSVGKLSPFVSTGGSSNGYIPTKPN